MKKYITRGATDNPTVDQKQAKEDYTLADINDTAPREYAVVNGMVIPISAATEWDFK